jgi:hypothetical protein
VRNSSTASSMYAWQMTACRALSTRRRGDRSEGKKDPCRSFGMLRSTSPGVVETFLGSRCRRGWWRWLRRQRGPGGRPASVRGTFRCGRRRDRRGVSGRPWIRQNGVWPLEERLLCGFFRWNLQSSSRWPSPCKGALSLMGIEHRFTAARRERLGELLLEHADQLSRILSQR